MNDDQKVIDKALRELYMQTGIDLRKTPKKHVKLCVYADNVSHGYCVSIISPFGLSHEIQSNQLRTYVDNQLIKTQNLIIDCLTVDGYKKFLRE